MKKIDKDFIIETERLIIKIPDYSNIAELYDLIDENTTKFMEWDKVSNLKDYYKLIDNRVENAINGKRCIY